MRKEDYEVRQIKRADCSEFILGIHYAKRWPSISFAFGLFKGEDLVGVCTYGTPSSAPLRRGVAGDEFAALVLELNRLCLRDNIKNEASFLVAASLKMIPKCRIVVSFADSSQGHHGGVYQASNFLFCGMSAKRTDWKVRGKEHLHGQTIADEFRGFENRAQAMRDKYGDDFYLAPRPRKFRYVYITGPKSFKQRAMSALRYLPCEYPKELSKCS